MFWRPLVSKLLSSSHPSHLVPWWTANMNEVYPCLSWNTKQFQCKDNEASLSKSSWLALNQIPGQGAHLPAVSLLISQDNSPFPTQCPRLVEAEQFLEVLICLDGKREGCFSSCSSHHLPAPCHTHRIQGNSFFGCKGALSPKQVEDAGKLRQMEREPLWVARQPSHFETWFPTQLFKNSEGWNQTGRTGREKVSETANTTCYSLITKNYFQCWIGNVLLSQMWTRMVFLMLSLQIT